jgi:hypothetical protein
MAYKWGDLKQDMLMDKINEPAGTFLKIYPFVKGPFCYFCRNNIEHHNHADDQKDSHWQRLKT